MFAQRPTVAIYNDPVGRAPSSTQSLSPRIPATYSGAANATDFVAWEGFNSTNYLNRVQLQFSPNFADIAVGPTDILTVVNRRIARWPNPKAMGATPITNLYQAPTNEALLDSWLGTGLLNYLCPTIPRSAISCLFENATVRYDQMHGRFVVLMAVIDTGIQAFGFTPTQPRKASWVIAVSKYATFLTPTQGAPGVQQPSASGSSDLFISPTPATGSNNGTLGWNSQNWNFYFGDGTETFGNINAATDYVTNNGVSTSALQVAAPFDCSVTAGTNQSTTSVCYFPTSARLGFDNDNVIVTSSVINANANSQNPTIATPATGSFAGTRVRVFKKTFLYAKLATSPSTSGVSSISVAPGSFLIPDYTADYYDLYAYAYNNGRLGALLPANFTGVALYSPYTLAPPVDSAGAIVAVHCEPEHLRGRPAASFSNALLYGATSGQSPINGAGQIGSQATSYIACIQSTSNLTAGSTVQYVYVQPIASIAPPNPQLANTNSNSAPANSFGVPYYPTVIGTWSTGLSGAVVVPASPVAGTIVGGVAGPGANGQMQTALVAPFANPTQIPQAPARDGTAAPTLYVGDNRPQRLVFREGHLYEAHNASSGADYTVPTVTTTPNATVQYTIIQSLAGLPTGATPVPVPPVAAAAKKVVMRAQWWNALAWGPQYDVPANVSLSNQVSPINTLPWLEKLFVATTFPALSPTDPRIATQSSDPGSSNASLSATLCAYGGPGNPYYDPSQPNAYGTPAYAGLYDQRCGTDAYDTRQNYRDPVLGNLIVPTGSNTTAPGLVSISTRNAATIDPHDGSLWNYGLYATRRFTSVVGPGQWSTYVSNYNMSFPTTDPYGNASYDYKDVPAGHPFYNYIKIAQNVGLINPPNGGAISGVSGGGTVTLTYPNTGATVMPSFVNTAAGSQGDVNTQVSRAEMAKYVMTSLMDELAISQYLNATGGCANSFADVAPPSGCVNNLIPINSVPSAGTVTLPGAPFPAGTQAVFYNGANVGMLYLNGAGYNAGNAATGAGASGGWRYIEAMYRRGITKGCGANTDARAKFCPGDTLTRGQMAVFLIRAKMSNVFPTSLNGCPTLNIPTCIGGQAGDNFSLFVAGASAGANGYFSDVATTDEYWIYVQKMFEMRISDGISPLPTLKSDNTIASQGLFGSTQNLTRGQVLVFVVRAFFF